MRPLVWSEERRLRNRPEFAACFEKGTKRHTRSFVIFALRRKDGPAGARLGLTVSRKVGPAVWRNRIKRVVREFFRLYQYEFPARLDLVVIPKRNLDPRRLTLALAEREFAPLLARLQTPDD